MKGRGLYVKFEKEAYVSQGWMFFNKKRTSIEKDKKDNIYEWGHQSRFARLHLYLNPSVLCVCFFSSLGWSMRWYLEVNMEYWRILIITITSLHQINLCNISCGSIYHNYHMAWCWCKCQGAIVLLSAYEIGEKKDFLQTF